MTAIMRNDANGLGSGLVVLRELVAGDRPIHGQSLRVSFARPTSESCIMSVVSQNLEDLIQD